MLFISLLKKGDMMSKKFRHIVVPDSWEKYWAKYPRGYTILEALVDWVTHVNKLSDNVSEWNLYLDQFVKRFDEDLQETVKETLIQWQEDGFLDFVLNDVVQGMIDDFLEGSTFINNVRVEQKRDSLSETTYYLTYIPATDGTGATIDMKRGFANDVVNGGTGETARSFAERHGATVVINASTFDVNTYKLAGLQIHNGTVISEGAPGYRYALAFNPNREMKAYPVDTDPQQILDDGFTNALTGFIPLIENSSEVDRSIIEGYGAYNERHPRQVIAKRANNDIIILTCDGRTPTDQGMTVDDLIRILISIGVEFAYMLDGGGSNSTVVRGQFINKRTDNGGYDERKVADFIYFGKDTPRMRDIDTVKLGSDIGRLGKELNDIFIKLQNKIDFPTGYIQLKASETFDFHGIEVYKGDRRTHKLNLRSDEFNYWDYDEERALFRVTRDGRIQSTLGTLGAFFNFARIVNSLNDIDTSGIYWATASTAGHPTGSGSFVVLHVQVTTVEKMQIAFPYSTTGGNIYTRRDFSGSWSDWVTLN